MLAIRKVFQSIVEGDEVGTVASCLDCIQKGHSAMEILEKGMIPAMNQCGVLLTKRKCFIPQVLMSTRAMQAGVDVLRPYIEICEQEKRLDSDEFVVIGTVSGDVHTIGKTLVAIMLESVGFEVVDLGTNVALDEFIEGIEASGSRFVNLSAMLTTAMISMREIVKGIKAHDFGREIHIIVGGAPITTVFAKEIGAIYAENPIECMEKLMAIQGRSFKD